MRCLARPAPSLAALALGAGALLAGCGGDAPPGAAPRPSRAPLQPEQALRVEVALGAGPDRHPLPDVEVSFIPEALMVAHLERRQAEVAGRLERLRAETERLHGALARQQAVNEQASQAYARQSGDYLRDRTALNLSRGHSASDVTAARASLSRDRRTARLTAEAVARDTLAAERRLHAVRAELERVQTETLLAGLPQPMKLARTGPDGRAELTLPPGRYAAVGLAPAGAGAPAGPWLGWVEVQARPGLLVLDDASARALEPGLARQAAGEASTGGVQP
ncbi:MAG: hypothetical protein QM767_30085 [Anaeromyxobacter sp.]